MAVFLEIFISNAKYVIFDAKVGVFLWIFTRAVAPAVQPLSALVL